MASEAPAALPTAGMIEAARRSVIGRVTDIEVVAAALSAGRSVLLEGPPGTGKTTLLRALADGAGMPLIVVEGNAELSPGRLIGAHDPSRLLSEGYTEETFLPGPLVEAMTSGALLYVEELNRVPEETLNVLLGVLSERSIHVARYGAVDAVPSFRLVAAMNPFDAVGTGRISPALYDRTCRVALGYQGRAEEEAIVAGQVTRPEARESTPPELLIRAAVGAARASREHPDLRIGASVRGALDLVAVTIALGAVRNGQGDWRHAGADAARAALSGRITRREGVSRTVEDIVEELWREAVAEVDGPGEVPGEGKAAGPGRLPARTGAPDPAVP
jgi:MoxR-like ATPase